MTCQRSGGIAVCVVSYRRPDLLRRCLESVQRSFPDVPVYIWDNASSETPAIRNLAIEWPSIRWTFSEKNIGFAAAVNKLATQAEEYDMLLLNPDAQLTARLDETLRLAAMEGVAAVAPELDRQCLNKRQKAWDVAHKSPNVWRSIVSHAGYAARLRGLKISELYMRRPATVSGYLTGACLLITRRAWHDVGPMNEEFFLYGEEVEWQQRAVARGWSLYVANEENGKGFLHASEGTTRGSAAQHQRSRDLLRFNESILLAKLRGPGQGTVFILALALLDRIQRSKRQAADQLSKTTPSLQVIITSNTLGFGGAERQRVLLAGGLAARGFSVTVVCLQKLGPLVAELSPSARLIRRPWWFPNSDRHHGSVLITGTTKTEVAFGMIWRFVRRGGKWLTAVHNPPAPSQPTFGRLLAKCMSLSNGVIALDQAHWKELTKVQHLHTKAYFVPNGIECTTPFDYTARRPLRLVMLGRIAPQKNHTGLIEALASLMSYEWSLTVFGDGPIRDVVEASVMSSMRTRVRWKGWVSGPDEAFAEADVLCVPSTREAFPLVILEAMARGIPVVATANCSVPEMLEHGRCGVLVPTASVADWQRSLEEVLAEPQRLAGLARRAKDRWAEKYSCERMIDRYAEVIYSVSGTSSTGV